MVNTVHERHQSLNGRELLSLILVELEIANEERNKIMVSLDTLNAAVTNLNDTVNLAAQALATEAANSTPDANVTGFLSSVVAATNTLKAALPTTATPPPAA